MKALVLAPFNQQTLEVLSKRISIVYEPWTRTKRIWDPEELGARIKDEDINILVVEVDFIFDEVLRESPPLQLVGLCRNALNHVELDSAVRHGVLVVNTPGRNAQAVAELTIGMMFALSRQFHQAHNYVKNRLWVDPIDPYISLRGTELRGKTLGVVGFGSIGRKVGRLAHSLGLRILANDPFVIPPAYVQRTTLDSLLTNSDFVSLHIPENPKLEPIINKSSLELMKPTAFLINTSSSSLVEEDALLSALDTNELAGAALDVFQTHPVISTSPLLKRDNILFTPHLGGATEETIDRYSESMARDLRLFLLGQTPQNLVKPDPSSPESFHHKGAGSDEI